MIKKIKVSPFVAVVVGDLLTAIAGNQSGKYKVRFNDQFKSDFSYAQIKNMHTICTYIRFRENVIKTRSFPLQYVLAQRKIYFPIFQLLLLLNCWPGVLNDFSVIITTHQQRNVLNATNMQHTHTHPHTHTHSASFIMRQRFTFCINTSNICQLLLVERFPQSIFHSMVSCSHCRSHILTQTYWQPIHI